MTDIKAADMSLMSVDELAARLAVTEPLESTSFETGEVSFELGDWNKDSPGELDEVDAKITVEGREFTLTAESLLEATSLCGLPKGYVRKSPPELTEACLNFWYGFEGMRGTKNMPRQFKALTAGEKVMALTRDTVEPFSNLKILEQVTESICSYYGTTAADLFVDYKMNHSLRTTSFRVIVPEVTRTIKSYRHTGAKPDNWSVGIQVHNSLSGETATSIQGYMFAWWCTNGCTDINNTSGAWSRRGLGGNDTDDLFNWVGESSKEIMDKLESGLDRVARLVDVPISGDAGQIAQNLFDRHSAPQSIKDAVIESLVESDDLSMYGLMQAVTQTANAPGLAPALVSKILEMGGDVAQSFGNGLVSFVTPATPELMALHGSVPISVGGSELTAKVRKLPSDD